ncbi:MAG: DUF6798 domain-containing protein, partial [Phormidesmis sp.]
LIGFLPACLWGISLLLETVWRKRFGKFVGAAAVFVLLVGLVYVPMVMAGNTSSDALTDDTFVHLYGYIRHPHHIVLSTFPTKDWRDFICLTATGLGTIQLSSKLSAAHKRDLALTIAISCSLLAVGEVFVEKIPLALVAKLQFARVTPFAMLAVWMALSVVASEYYQRKNYPVSLLLVAMPLVDKVGSILLLVFVLLLLLAKKINSHTHKRSTFLKPLIQLHTLSLHRPKDIKITYGLFFLVLLACWSFFPMLFASLAYPLTEQASPKFFRRSRTYIKAATVGLCLYLSLHLSGLIGNTALTPLHRKITLYAPPTDTLAQVAAAFEQVSEPDDLVLVPPSDEVFRFYSQRSVVVTFKSFPFTDQGILIWQTRLEEILGPLSLHMMSAEYTHELYRQRSSEELMTLARAYGASYILTQPGWHPELVGRVVARGGEWEVWELSLPEVAAAN